MIFVADGCCVVHLVGFHLGDCLVFAVRLVGFHLDDWYFAVDEVLQLSLAEGEERLGDLRQAWRVDDSILRCCRFCCRVLAP